MIDFDHLISSRCRWCVALGALEREAVLALGAELAARFVVAPANVPRAGLTLLALRDSVEQQAFYLGEAPLSTSHVTISDGIQTVEGGAMLMADDTELVNAIAICDGVLANRMDGWLDVAQAIEAGQEHLDQEARFRKTILKRSRVNFSLLNEEDHVEGKA